MAKTRRKKHRTHVEVTATWREQVGDAPVVQHEAESWATQKELTEDVRHAMEPSPCATQGEQDEQAQRFRASLWSPRHLAPPSLRHRLKQGHEDLAAPREAPR